MRVAIVCDWLVSYAGGERVVEQILRLFPQADLFSSVDFFSKEDRKYFMNKHAKTSFIQNLPFAKRFYRSYLPWMPFAMEQLDLRPYELIISSSSSVAKGVLTGPYQLHISYCHSPMRYAWDLQYEYLERVGRAKGLRSWLYRYLLYRMRFWDHRCSEGVDFFLANSRFIQRRIAKIYRRRAEVIHPPVDVESFTLQEEKEDFFLTASRLVPYKRIDLIAQAFEKMPDKKLYIIGDGPEMKRLKSYASKNIIFLGFQSQENLRLYMQRAKAFIFAALEDFGISPIEAQACGTPVIAYGQGGVLDSIRSSEEATGLFFYEQTASSIIDAVKKFELRKEPFSPQACRNNALAFSQQVFLQKFSKFIEQAKLQWEGKVPSGSF